MSTAFTMPTRKKTIPLKKFDRLTLTEALHLRLGVIDATALSLCRENKLPIIVFDFRTKDSIERVVMGESIGTIVSGE